MVSFAGKLVHIWGMYSSFREEWRYSGDGLSYYGGVYSSLGTLAAVYHGREGCVMDAPGIVSIEPEIKYEGVVWGSVGGELWSGPLPPS